MDGIVELEEIVRVILEIVKLIFIHVLKFCQTEQFLFITVLEYLNGLNKFCHCGQSRRGLQYTSFDSQITLITSVFVEI